EVDEVASHRLVVVREHVHAHGHGLAEGLVEVDGPAAHGAVAAARREVVEAGGLRCLADLVDDAPRGAAAEVDGGGSLEHLHRLRRLKPWGWYWRVSRMPARKMPVRAWKPRGVRLSPWAPPPSPACSEMPVTFLNESRRLKTACSRMSVSVMAVTDCGMSRYCSGIRNRFGLSGR